MIGQPPGRQGNAAGDAIVRCDGSPEIGTGHLIRCLALAHGLARAGFQVVFATKPYDDRLVRKIKREGYAIQLLPLTYEPEQDARLSIGLAAVALRRPIFVLDSYELPATYHRAVMGAGLCLVLIDDLARGAVAADILVNQNISAGPEVYAKQELGRVLLGPRYALLREEFRTLRRRVRPASRETRRVLVTLGGADPDGQTFKAVKAIGRLKEKEGIEAVVILGHAHPDPAGLQTCIAETGRPIRLLAERDDIGQWMLDADVAISGGGTTCLELACLGVPNLILILSEEQRGNAEGLDAAGVSFNLGQGSTATEAQITEALEALLANPSRRGAMTLAGRALVDGDGVSRVVSAIQETVGA